MVLELKLRPRSLEEVCWRKSFERARNEVILPPPQLAIAFSLCYGFLSCGRPPSTLADQTGKRIGDGIRPLQNRRPDLASTHVIKGPPDSPGNNNRLGTEQCCSASLAASSPQELHHFYLPIPFTRCANHMGKVILFLMGS